VSAPRPVSAPDAGAEVSQPGRDGFGAGQATATHGSNGAFPAAGPDTGLASASGSAPDSIFTAPVPDDGLASPADPPAEASQVPAPAPAPIPAPAAVSAAAHEMPRQEPGRPERVTVAPDAADSSSYRPAHAEGAAKTFDVATTRRRPVVFEEDDDLDVPDFLK
jgi:cell division protein FtsZ